MHTSGPAHILGKWCVREWLLIKAINTWNIFLQTLLRLLFVSKNQFHFNFGEQRNVQTCSKLLRYKKQNVLIRTI